MEREEVKYTAEQLKDAQECQAEIDKILAKHKCRIDPLVILGPRGYKAILNVEPVVE